MDLSHLDKKYFVDVHKYNCPFCKRGSVSYKVTGKFEFDWSQDKECFGYIIQCESEGCGNKSLHLSYNEIGIYRYHGDKNRFNINTDINIDGLFFYSQPTSFFTLDSRIPREIRELVSEAEGCRQMNYLVGASSCLRKAIYKLLKREDIPGTGYEDRIKNLKTKFPHVDKELFNALSGIQNMTCDLVHEDSWDGWDSSHLNFLIELTKAILVEIYVVPQEKKSVLDKLSKLRTEPQKGKSSNQV